MPSKTLTIARIADIFLRLNQGRDRMLKPRLMFWVDRAGDTMLEELTRSQVRDALIALKTEPAADGRLRSGPTINRYRAALGSMIAFARDNDLVSHDWISPLSGMKQAKENPGLVRYLSHEEEDRLMAAAELVRWPLLPLLVRTAIVTGLRAGALQGLLWANVKINDDNPRIEVARTKNGEPHVSPLTPDLVVMFRKARRLGALDTDYVFSGANPHRPHSWRECFAKAMRKARIEGATFHTLRHTSCSRLAEAGVDAIAIAEHSGHKTMSMVRRYAHLNVKRRASIVQDVFG
ncbi:site-specific integrase [Uliginosibacterium sp. H3]|uniref:Site-specific integrase n=1 Tax=Uliginosibacterium silvisoli TaxID=3114758 RepID=A0ABU6K5V1_9RHOO|nr:site-specific integrase [Uliginosibacterium sp. H3]